MRVHCWHLEQACVTQIDQIDASDGNEHVKGWLLLQVDIVQNAVKSYILV
jgi:hypothetical protein